MTATFEFNEQVAAVFDDMLHRSIPGYLTLQQHLVYFARTYAQSQSYCYDLGCSLGTTTNKIAHALVAIDCPIIAVDLSWPMISRAKDKFQHSKNNPKTSPIYWIQANIQDFITPRASIIILNLTLQFIPIEQRNRVINTLYQNLLPQGILLLVEKIHLPNQSQQQQLEQWYFQFKRYQGYNDAEIASKKQALKKVLVTESPEDHRQRLQMVGFSNIQQWFQCLNFAAFIAQKS